MKKHQSQPFHLFLRKLRHFMRFNLPFINDIKDIDHESIIKKLKDNTELSFSYLLLLGSSTIVCTLGLLLGSAPIVIGGMIISPLMWPLMKIALGVAYKTEGFTNQALRLLIFSIILTLFFSFFITYISPIKLVNPEILARTNPTLLDIIVALAAGGIAAFAMVQKKISDSLAGVAIATSLLPPLCVSGIGLALNNYQIAIESFLLFLANVISIIFVSVFVYMLVGFHRRTNDFQQKGILMITVILIATSLPLVSYLTTYSFKARAYDISQEVLGEYFKNISSSISVQNVKTRLQKQSGEDVVFIDADVIIPEDVILDYNQKNEIITQLEKELNKKIDLNLRIQKSIALQSKDEVVLDEIKTTLTQTFRDEIKRIDASISISALDVYEYNSYWYVNAVLRSNPTTTFSERQFNDLEKTLQKKINQLVILKIEVISRLQLKSQPELENEKIKKDIESFIETISPDLEIEGIVLQTNKGKINDTQSETITTRISIRTPESYIVPLVLMQQLRHSLESKYNKTFKLQMELMDKRTYFVE